MQIVTAPIVENILKLGLTQISTNTIVQFVGSLNEKISKKNNYQKSLLVYARK